MANRYRSFDLLVEGVLVFPDTLGNHWATVASQGDAKVVVGSRDGRVTLRKGDTLGYNCGRVWLVPRPESYKDPVRRVLAEAKVPQRVLKYEVTLSEPPWMPTGQPECPKEGPGVIVQLRRERSLQTQEEYTVVEGVSVRLDADKDQVVEFLRQILPEYHYRRVR